MDDTQLFVSYYDYCNCSLFNYTDCNCFGTGVLTLSGIDVFLYTLIWVLWFITITGNVLIIVVFIRDRQLRSNAANLLILNLSCTDLLIGMNSLTFSNLTRHFDDFWMFGEVMCKIYMILDYSASTQSAFAITLISCDRLILVTKGVQYKNYQTPTRAKLWIAASWFTSLNLFCIPFLVSDYRYGRWVESYSGIMGDCDFAILFKKWYNVLRFVLTFAIPLVLLIIFNSIVYHNVRMRAIRPTGSCKSGLSSKNNHRGSDFKKHRKAAITLAIIVVAFLICWIPLWVKDLVYEFVSLDSDYWLFNTDACAYLSWSNSALNPFLYAATNPRIRAGLAALLCRSRLPQSNTGY